MYLYLRRTYTSCSKKKLKKETKKEREMKSRKKGNGKEHHQQYSVCTLYNIHTYEFMEWSVIRALFLHKYFDNSYSNAIEKRSTHNFYVRLFKRKHILILILLYGRAQTQSYAVCSMLIGSSIPYTVVFLMHPVVV